MTNNKTSMLTVKLPVSRLAEFKIVATLRGTTMSALVAQYIAKEVRQEMEQVPSAFRRSGLPSSFGHLLDEDPAH